MLALVLGAGFSKWAADLPLGSELFDFAIEPFGTREKRWLERVRRLKQGWDAGNPHGLVEQFIAHVLCGRDDSAKQNMLWYLVRRLSEPYIWQEWHAWRMRRHVLMIDENRKWQRAGVRRAAHFIAECGTQLSGIITLNYDLLVEYSLGSKGFNYGTPGEVLTGRGPYPVSQWRNPVSLTGGLPLAKLHGSISWDFSHRYTDGRRGLTGRALIVAPTPDKQPPAALKDQWDLSQRILERASRILVFGVGFNEYDEAVLVHFRDAGRYARQVAIVDVSSRTEAARKLWPQCEIRWFQPPTEQRGELRDWLRIASESPQA